MNETLCKYLAGLLDADGSVSFNYVHNKEKNWYTLALQVVLASSDAVDTHGFVGKLPDATGFGRALKYSAEKRSFSKNQFNRWTVASRRDLEMFVPRVSKYMQVKATHMQRMLEKLRELRGARLSAEDCDALREFSRLSRIDSGPIKPKNHPSPAWLAGYLDGNGSYLLKRFKANVRNGKQFYQTQCNVRAICHVGDVHVLKFIQKAHGGYIREASSSSNCMVWARNLGNRERSFAVNFLAAIVPHAQLKKHKIEQMLSFHHQQRLSIPSPTG